MLACTYTDSIVYGYYENTSISDFAGPCRQLYSLYRFFDINIPDNDRDKCTLYTTRVINNSSVYAFFPSLSYTSDIIIRKPLNISSQ